MLVSTVDPTRTFKIPKRDTHAIWFKHLPAELIGNLELLDSNESVELVINGRPTGWARMRRSPRGPTPGIRIETGRQAWERIQRGEAFTLETAVPGMGIPLRPKEATASTRLLRHRRGNRGPLFGGYEFADFSGARDIALQRRSIRLAVARGDEEPWEPAGRSLTRDGLQAETLRRLEAATRKSVRLAFGRDHQFSIPMGLAHEIGLRGQTWRECLESLGRGTYGGPRLAHVFEYASRFNNWSMSRSRPPYFFSRTKAGYYGVPGADPRPSRFGAIDPTTYRLTELCQGLRAGRIPKPLNQIGDNGTVGGQTVVGLILLRELLDEAQRRDIPLAVWPFDGLDISSAAYDGRHVMFEPYPSSVRDPDVKQSDWNDAVASVLCIQRADQAGGLAALLDLEALTNEQRTRVQFEGWIVGHRP
jgi:hypothetical protein